jgi:mRNA interferase RelE/StbE
MSYELSILPKAQKELLKLPDKIYKRLKKEIHSLSHIPRPRQCLKLSGRNAWRIRVGDYRVIYEI